MDNIQYKCAYCGFLLHSMCSNYLEHLCFKNIIEETVNKKLDLVADANNVLQLVEAAPDATSAINSQPGDGFNLEEALISAVQAKRPLWDAKIAVSERSSLKIKDLWTQIAHEFEDRYSVETLKKRWRQLRDDFMRTKRKVNVYVPSGSSTADVPLKPKFKYYDVMKFLDDPEEYRGISNVHLGPPESLPSTSSQSTPDLQSPTTPQTKRKRSTTATDASVEMQHEILKSLREAPQRQDGVDGFLILLGDGLRRLPLRNRNRLQIQFLTMLEEEEERCNDI